MSEVAIDVLTYVCGAAAIAGAARRWLTGLGRAPATIYLVLAALAVSPALLTTRTQVALDYAYQFSPWRSEYHVEPVAENPLLTDVALQILPFRHLVRQRLLNGDLPLWSHELGTGQPLMGNAQSAPFSPLHLMSLFLPPERALTVTAAWQVLLALVGMHLLSRRLGASVAGSALAAVAYALSTFAFGWLYYPLAMCAAWIPALLATTLAVLQGTGPPLGVTLCLVGLLSSGHPQAMALGVLAMGLTAITATARLEGGQARAGLRRLLLGSAAAFLLTAPILLAIGQTLVESERWLDVVDGGSMRGAATLRALVPLLAPLAEGSPRWGNWSGAGNFQESATLYLGALPLALGLAGASRRHRGTATWMLLAGVALVVGLGLVPGGLLRAPWLAALLDRRVRMLWTLLVALAAGRGLDLALAHPATGRRAALAVVLAGGVAVGWVAPSAATWVAVWRVVVVVATIVSAIVLTKSRGAWRGPVLVGLVAGDLLLLGVPYNPATPFRRTDPPPPAVVELQRLTTAEPAVPRVAALGGRFPGYLPAIEGLWDPRGWDPARPGETARRTRDRLRGDRPGSDILLKEGFDRGFLDFLGVRFVLAGARADLPPDWSIVWRRNGQAIWRNPSASTLFSGGVDGHSIVEAAEPVSNGFDLRLSASEVERRIASSVTWAPGWRASAEAERRRVLRLDGGFLGVEAQPGDRRLALRYAPVGWSVSLWCALAGAILVVSLSVRGAEGRPRWRGDA